MVTLTASLVLFDILFKRYCSICEKRGSYRPPTPTFRRTTLSAENWATEGGIKLGLAIIYNGYIYIYYNILYIIIYTYMFCWF